MTEDWYFLSHRLPMARAARDAGFEVHVATRVLNGGGAIEAEGFTAHSTPFARGSLSPASALAAIWRLRQIHRSVCPDLCHHVAVQAAVLGSLALAGRRTPCVNALTGMGFAFSSGSAKARLLRLLLGRVLRALLDRPGRVGLVQNPDDCGALVALGLSPARIELIPGSGVDTVRFSPQPEPEGPITAAFVGRLLDDKGVRTLVEAYRLLRQRGIALELLIAGAPDAANPASVPVAEAEGWNHEPGLRWLGAVTDIASLWSRSHIAVLPSRREGLPMSLLEAAACGRPMVATDVPGCREVVVDGETGLLVPVDDAAALADALERIAGDGALRGRLGEAARRRVVERFSSERIGAQTVELYHRLIGAGA